MNIKNNKLLIMIGFILLIICIILFYNNRNMRSQLDQERAETLLSVFRLGGKSDNWKINDGVLINTSNRVYLRIKSIDYIGEDYYLSENMSIMVQFRDKKTGQKEKHTSGYRYNSEELKDFKTGKVGVSYPREILEYSKHNIVIEIKYDDEKGNAILEEIKVIPVWSFEDQ
ncbi:MAG: hypothetical protein FH753_04740 [Firmicutes bacterium]|nr:hypothetical protein [Bacillota bacterium]